MADRKVTINQTANVISRYRERNDNILYNEFGLRKVSAQLVPCLLTPDQKRTSLENLILRQIQLDFFGVSQPRMNFGFITLIQRHWNNPCSGHTNLHLKKAKVVSSTEKFSGLGMQK